MTTPLIVFLTLCSSVLTIRVEYTVIQNGSVNDDAYTGITIDESGYFYLVGWIENNLQDTFLTTFKDGIVHTDTIGTVFGDFPLNIKTEDSLNFIFLCGRLETISGIPVAFTIAVDKVTFEYIWTTNYVNQAISQFNSLVVDPSTDSLFAVGFTYGNRSAQVNQGLQDGWMVKLQASTGQIVWNRLIGSSANDSFKDVALDDEGNLWAVGFAGGSINGSSWNSTGSLDFLIVQFNQDGDVLSLKQFGGYKDDVIENIVYNGSFLYLLATSQAFFNNNGTYNQVSMWRNLVLLKMEALSLDIIWTASEEAEDDNIWVTGLFKEGSTLYVCGYTSASYFKGSSNHGATTSDILFALFNEDDGTLEFSELFGTSENEQAASLYVTSENILIAGFTNGSFGSSNKGGLDSILLELSEDHKEKKEIWSIGAVIGIAVGSLALLMLAATLTFVLIRRRKAAGIEQVHSEPTSRKDTDAHNNSQSSVYFQMSNFQPLPPPPKKHHTHLTQDHSWQIDYSEIILEKKIGQGAFGEVYKGKWRGSNVAVKQMLQNDGAKIEDFFAEAELMKKLRPHTNITQFMGFCENPVCIVTEYVAHGSLLALLKSHHEISDPLKIRIMKDTASGILHLHSEGIIHRDLAARNILLDKSNRAKVSDFGMSRITNHQTGKSEAEVGPIAWMAPEALTEKIYNTKTDVWSFGVVIFEVLTRKKPYQELNLMQIGVNIVLGKLSLIPELETKEDSYPLVLMKLARACLQFNPNHRPEFQEILSTLTEADNSSTSAFSEVFYIK